MNKIALILFSGGIDSQIAKLLIAEQNIPYELITFYHGFNDKDFNNVKKYFKDEPITFLDITERFVRERLFTPKYNYGKGFNPCRDCHQLMTEIAWEYGLKKYGEGNFFLVTGEVVGQRPNSQRFDTLRHKNPSLMEQYTLRPLSAKVLPETIPEKKGWVNRDKLLGIVGKSRKIQMDYIKKYQLYNLTSPGCWLAQKDIKKRMINIKNIFGSEFDAQDVIAMRYGRHFKLSEKDLLVVSRNESETNKLLNYKGNKFILLNNIVIGPVGLLSSHSISDDNIVKKAFEIILAYSKAEDNAIYEYILNGKNYSVKKKDKKEFADMLL